MTQHRAGRVSSQGSDSLYISCVTCGAETPGQRGEMRAAHTQEMFASAESGAEVHSVLLLRRPRAPGLHAALWRGSILSPFMSPDNQQPPRGSDQTLANFHTTCKQRLHVGAVQPFLESVFSLSQAFSLPRIKVMSTGALVACGVPAERQTV